MEPRDSTERGRRRAVVLWIVVAVLTAVAVWALFRFVVSDDLLLLEYLKVLVWPALIGLILFWLRSPLREKLAQLLRVDAFGASAQFSEAQGRRLQAELGPALEDLFGDPAGSDEEQPADGPLSSTDAGSDLPDDRGAAAEQSGPQPVDGPVQEGIPVADVVEIAESLGLSKTSLEDVRSGLGDPERRNLALRTIRGQATKARKARTQLASTDQQSRDSIESIIRKSAAWGYEMGVAGAPEAVPDIEWSEDGGWRITTEVPARRRTTSRPAQIAENHTDRARHIRSLEQEIIEMEQKQPVAGLTVLGANPNWLIEVKRRLGRIDPGNPWSM